MKIILKYASIVIIVVIMCALIAFPRKYIQVAFDGIKLWCFNVLPALFPFFFFTLLITKLGCLDNIIKNFTPISKKIFRCNGIALYVFILSILSGYPIGAKLIDELFSNGRIGKDEATRMSTFCSTSGPLFVIGTVGTVMFNNQAIGIVIFLSHVISAILCGKIFCKYGDFKENTTCKITQKKDENILYDSIYSSVISILCVGGFICIFYLISSIISDIKIFSIFNPIISNISKNSNNATEIFNGFTSGIIECTTGCNILSKYASVFSVSLAASLISLGGISIVFQSLIYLTKAQVNIKIFLLSKILQSIISFILCYSSLIIVNIF